MRKSMGTVAAALLMALAAHAPAADVVDDSVGYSLPVPDGWRAIPKEAIDQTRDVIAKPGAPAPNFIAAFEPESNASHFQYPYAMVQVHDYGRGMSLSTVSRSEVEQMVKGLTGVSSDRLKQTVSDDAAKLIGDAAIDAPAMTTNPPGFVRGTRLQAAPEALVFAEG